MRILSEEEVRQAHRSITDELERRILELEEQVQLLWAAIFPSKSEGKWSAWQGEGSAW